jgi:hypothetical protein
MKIKTQLKAGETPTVKAAENTIDPQIQHYTVKLTNA